MCTSLLMFSFLLLSAVISAVEIKCLIALQASVKKSWHSGFFCYRSIMEKDCSRVAAAALMHTHTVYTTHSFSLKNNLRRWGKLLPLLLLLCKKGKMQYTTTTYCSQCWWCTFNGHKCNLTHWNWKAQFQKPLWLLLGKFSSKNMVVIF